MKNIIVASIVFLVSLQAYSQNYLMESDESGFHTFLQLGSNKGITTIAVSPGYTFNGRFMIGGTVGMESESSEDYKAYLFKPYMNYMLLKQDDYMPVSFGLGGSYQYAFTSGLSDYLVSESKIHSFGLDASLYHRLYVSDDVSIVPGAFIGWSNSTVKFEHNYAGYPMPVSESSSSIGYGLQVTGLFRNIQVTPNLQFASGTTLFNVLVGVVFPR